MPEFLSIEQPHNSAWYLRNRAGVLRGYIYCDHMVSATYWSWVAYPDVSFGIQYQPGGTARDLDHALRCVMEHV